MGSSTDRRNAELDNLLKGLHNFNARHYILDVVTDLSKYLLNVFRSDGLHNLHAVKSDINSFLPAPTLILSREAFRNGFYPVVILHETVPSFNAFPISSFIINALSLTDRASGSLIAFFWVSAAYVDDKNKVLEMVDAYNKIRTSSPF